MALISGILSILLFSGTAFAANECRVIEHPDHYEAVCEGSPAYKNEQQKQDDTKPMAINGAQVSKKRQRIEDIRSLNAHRTDIIESQAPTDTIYRNK